MITVFIQQSNMSNPALAEALKKKFGRIKGHGDWLRIPCPTCTPHDRPKMKRYVPANGHVSSCFICGIKQDVAFLLGADYVPSQIDSVDYDEEDEKEVDPRALRMPCTKAIPVNLLPRYHPAKVFLQTDFLNDFDTYANLHKIVYVPYEGGIIFNNGSRFITSAERIVFPVFFEQKLVGWQMRSLPGTFYGDQPDEISVRYYHLFNKGSYLYNYDQARNHKRVIVVEGVKKALKFPNGVATWGAGISRKQLKLIQTWDEIVMMLDSDPGNNTQQRAKGFVDGINSCGRTKAINIDLGKYQSNSPDELDSDTLNQIVEREWHDQHNQNR